MLVTHLLFVHVIDGSIPSEFCNTSGINLGVGDAKIACYYGCLTSSPILITGASGDCHDGYMIIIFSSIGVALVLTLSLVNINLARCVDVLKRVFPKFDPPLQWPEGGTAAKPHYVVGISVVKLVLVVFTSLFLTQSRWWQLSGNSEVVESCANADTGDLPTLDVSPYLHNNPYWRMRFQIFHDYEICSTNPPCCPVYVAALYAVVLQIVCSSATPIRVGNISLVSLGKWDRGRQRSHQ